MSLSREEILSIKEYAGGGRGWPDGREIWPTMAELCDMALQFLDGWVACDERLPPFNTEVLIAFAETSLPATAQLVYSHEADFAQWLYPAENHAEDGSEWTVTHWRPLPAPPEAS